MCLPLNCFFFLMFLCLLAFVLSLILELFLWKFCMFFWPHKYCMHVIDSSTTWVFHLFLIEANNLPITIIFIILERKLKKKKMMKFCYLNFKIISYGFRAMFLHIFLCGHIFNIDIAKPLFMWLKKVFRAKCQMYKIILLRANRDYAWVQARNMITNTLL